MEWCSALRIQYEFPHLPHPSSCPEAPDTYTLPLTFHKQLETRHFPSDPLQQQDEYMTHQALLFQVDHTGLNHMLTQHHSETHRKGKQYRKCQNIHI